MNDLKLNGGILIIGSLFWDKNEIRESWRSKYLSLDQHKNIPVPIRYGRISSERSYTYTMVFSSGCKENDLLGIAKAIPFLDNPVSIDLLKRQAKALIRAEQKKEPDKKLYNWSWGALGMIVNPLLSGELKPLLLGEWKKNFGKGLNPDHYKVGVEQPILNKQGILNIDWPEELEDFDFLIASAVKPEIDEYPDAAAIVAKMKESKYTEYFDKNSESGISTFLDKEIHAQLH